MTDRPTIFAAPMVIAMIEGRKFQTRRLATSPLRKCQVGDRLWVRENWRVSPEACEGWHPEEMRGWIDYQAGGSLELVAPSFDAVVRAAFLKGEEQDWDFLPSRYRPCIHMPRWASRLTLIVTDVRVEPLQAISEEDAAAEGAHVLDAAERHEHRGNRKWILGHCRDCAGWDPATMRKTAACPYRLGDERDQRDHYGAGCSTSFALRTTPEPSRFQFENLWSSLHFNPGETWRENPDVVAITFTVVRGNIDRAS